MKTLLKFGLASLSLATLGVTSTLPLAPHFGSTIVSANDATTSNTTADNTGTAADTTDSPQVRPVEVGAQVNLFESSDFFASDPVFAPEYDYVVTLTTIGETVVITPPVVPGYRTDDLPETFTYTQAVADSGVGRYGFVFGYYPDGSGNTTGNNGTPTTNDGTGNNGSTDSTTTPQPLSPNTGTVTLRPQKRIRYSFILEGVNDTNPAEGSTYLSEGETVTFPNWDPSYYELIEGETTLSYDRVTEGELYVLKVRKKQQTTDQQPPQADKKIIVGLANVDEGNGWADEVTLKPGETWTFDMSRLTDNGREYVSGPLSLNYDDVTNGHVYNVYFREAVKPAPDKPQATKTIYVGRDYDGRGGGRLITLKPGESYVLHDDSKPSGGWKYVSGSKVVTYDEVVDGGRYVVYYTQDETPAPDKDTSKPDTNQPDSTKPDANKPNPGTPVGYLPGKEKDSFIQPVTNTPASTTPQTGVTGIIGSQKPATSSADKAKPTTNGSASATQAPSGEQVAQAASKPAPASSGSGSATSTSSAASATTSTPTLPKTGSESSFALVATGASLVMASLGLAADRRKKA